MGRELGVTISTRWWSSAHVGSLIQIQFVYGIVGGGGAFWVTTADLRGLVRKFVERKMTYPDPSIWTRKFKAFYCGGLWNRVNSVRNVFACLHVEMLHWYRMFLGILIIIVSRQPKVNFFTLERSFRPNFRSDRILVSSRHTKREEVSLPVEVRRSKTPN